MMGKLEFNKKGATDGTLITVGDPISLASLIVAGVALGWNVYRDLKKDKKEKDEKRKKEKG